MLGNHWFVKGGGVTSKYQTQMSMWRMLAAPLMIGCDIRRMRLRHRHPGEAGGDRRRGARFDQGRKWELWHRNVVDALEKLDSLEEWLDPGYCDDSWSDS